MKADDYILSETLKAKRESLTDFAVTCHFVVDDGLNPGACTCPAEFEPVMMAGSPVYLCGPHKTIVRDSIQLELKNLIQALMQFKQKDEPDPNY